MTERKKMSRHAKKPGTLESALDEASAALDRVRSLCQTLSTKRDASMEVRASQAKNGFEEDLETYETAAEVAAFDAAKADLAAGRDELLPFALSERLSAGEPPIRVWREYRGLTQGQLAERAKLRQGTISDLERGRRASASFDAMCRIADALEVSLDDLRPTSD